MTEEFPEIPDFELSAVLSIVTGLVTETGNALFGEQGARQRRRDAMYAPNKKTNAAGNRQGSGFGNSTPKPRKPAKHRKKKSFIEKVPTRKSLRSTVGLGGKPKRAARLPRGATKGDIRRAGISSLRRGTKTLAAFIASRYSPEAIAKYNDYAGRLRRSKRLIKQIVEIDANTFRIKGYIIKTSTDGLTPYSCTCPDFSQFSDDARTWLGSKAGPFNPCKHMMAVRDRETGGKWVCSGGVCTFDPLAVTGYATQAVCEADREVLGEFRFTGLQCPVLYVLDCVVEGTLIPSGVPAFPIIDTSILAYGPIEKITRELVSPTAERFKIHHKDSLGNPVTTNTSGWNPTRQSMSVTDLYDTSAALNNCGDAPLICGTP